MKAKLLKTSPGGRQRYYELTEYVNNGKCLRGDCKVSEVFKDYFKYVRDEYKEELKPFMFDERGTKLVCVSDAVTHIERLVFPVVPIRDDYNVISLEIDGKHTFMSDGGDENSVYDDEVYLRHLAMLNGLKWEGFIKN